MLITPPKFFEDATVIQECLSNLFNQKALLPKAPQIILDVGGAAGAYAFPLTKMGYEVHLTDPISLHIKQAKEYAESSGIQLASYSVGDARAIDREDHSADVVLFFGPLYHLTEERDRLAALSEARRVLKPGGLLFAVGIARFAFLMDAMHKTNLTSKLEAIERSLTTGLYRKASEDLTFAYLHQPKMLKEEIRKSGFKNTILCAIEGPVWEKRVIEALQQDEKGWENLLGLLEKIETEESIIGASAHIMAIAKMSKPKEI